jgi:hypothetical protein
MTQRNQALTIPRAGTVWEIQATSSSSFESTQKFKNITAEETREGRERTARAVIGAVIPTAALLCDGRLSA